MEVHIAAISNIVLEPFFEKALRSVFGPERTITYQYIFLPEIFCIPDEMMPESIDYIAVLMQLNDSILNEFLVNSSAGDIAEGRIEKAVQESARLYNALKQRYRGKIIWFGYEGYHSDFKYVLGHVYEEYVTDQINCGLRRLMEPEDVFIDLKHMIAEIGINNAYDIKNKYRWNSPYSKTALEHIVEEIHKQFLVRQGVTKKCLILDCDNVLWGGILSEEGIGGIRLGNSGSGRPYQDFQKFVQGLYRHGVILAVCSRNDLSSVKMVFQEHSGMVLREENIACFQVNWNNKPDNIRRIAEKLNIGFDSMVFVDDSPLELEAVRALLPEVAVIPYSRYMSYEAFSCFNLRSHTEQDVIERRNRTYQTDGLRRQLKDNAMDYADYIRSLDIKVDIHRACPAEYGRLSELTQRTNQCTNGKRYTIAEIKERAALEHVFFYSVAVSDRFSDLGIVGAAEVEGRTLTLFCLSCRALGREVENKMMEHIMDRHNIETIDFVSTNKNDKLAAGIFGGFHLNRHY